MNIKIGVMETKSVSNVNELLAAMASCPNRVPVQFNGQTIENLNTVGDVRKSILTQPDKWNSLFEE